MTRAAAVLAEARRILADPNGSRWSDDRLLAILNQQQHYLASVSKVLQASTLAAVTPYTSTLVLPKNVETILRVEWDKLPLKLMSYAEMDQHYGDWQDTVGDTPKAAVYNLHMPGSIRIWPTMSWPSLEPYGLLTGVGEGTLSDVLGTSETIEGSVAIGDIEFGIVTTIDVPEYKLKVYYTFKPANITNPVLQELELPALFDSALLQFLVSYAYRDNVDTQSRDLANDHFSLGQTALIAARENKIIDYTTTTHYNVNYVGAF